MQQPRLAPLPRPWPKQIEDLLATYPQGPAGPIALFRTLAHSERTLRKVASAGVLDRQSPISLREREIVILRVSANAACEYEWGVHVLSFARKAGLDADQIRDTRSIRPDTALWTDAERVLFALADQLHARCDVDDALWEALTRHWNTAQIMEMLLLCGFYRMIAYFNNVLRVVPEAGAPTFDD